MPRGRAASPTAPTSSDSKSRVISRAIWGNPCGTGARRASDIRRSRTRSFRRSHRRPSPAGSSARSPPARRRRGGSAPDAFIASIPGPAVRNSRSLRPMKNNVGCSTLAPANCGVSAQFRSMFRYQLIPPVNPAFSRTTPRTRPGRPRDSQAGSGASRRALERPPAPTSSPSQAAVCADAPISVVFMVARTSAPISASATPGVWNRTM